MKNHKIKISNHFKSERRKNKITAISQFFGLRNYLINIIDSLSYSHLQPCSSHFQPCFSHKAALKQYKGCFFSASSQPIKYTEYKERFIKRLMIIAKFYSEHGRWGEIPRFTGKSPPRSCYNSENNNNNKPIKMKNNKSIKKKGIKILWLE